MLDIFKHIDEILVRYNIDKEKYFLDQIERTMGKVLKDVAKKNGRRVVIRGHKILEEVPHPFLTIVDKYMEIVAIQDRDLSIQSVYLSDTKEIPVIPIDSPLPPFDVYLINAIKSGEKIAKEVSGYKDNGITIINLYYEMNCRYGILPNQPFEWYDRLNKDYDFSCNRIKDALDEYKKDKNETTLLNLIGQCLFIGDFASIFRCIKKEKKIIETSPSLQAMISDIKIFIEEIKTAVNKRKEKLFGKKDIVWHWIDCVGYDDLKLIPKVKKHMDKGIYFQHAYTPTPYTKPTYRIIFYKESRECHEEGEGLYSEKNIEDSNLYENIMNHGYIFESFGYITRLIDETRKKEIELSTAATTLYLRMIQMMLNSNRPCFFIMHTLLETHPPYVSPWENVLKGGHYFCNTAQEMASKINISTRYADEVIDFYTNILGEQSIGIYMSDHGKWEYLDTRRYKDEAIHTFLGITNLGIEARVSRIFSYSNFGSLIKWILECNEQNEMVIEDISIYSEEVIDKAKENGGDVEELCGAFQGINTTDDKYVLFKNSKEFYFLKSEREAINRINDPIYKERIDYLKQKLKQIKKKD